MEIDIMNDIRRFVHERNWEQYHTGENLAKSVAIEAGELLEVFQWDGKDVMLIETSYTSTGGFEYHETECRKVPGRAKLRQFETI